MTLAGLRSLFRHHRQTTSIKLANPHRFRTTFASDMIRAGMSLPALMQLMGHSDIQTTLLYVQVTPQDVYRSEEHTSELQSQSNLVCRLLLEKKNTPPPHHSAVPP